MFLLRSSYSKYSAKYLRKSHDVDSIDMFFHRHFSLKSCFLSQYDSILPCPPFHIFIRFVFSQQSSAAGFPEKCLQLRYFLVLCVQLPLWHFLKIFFSVHFKLNSKRLYLSFLDISFLSSRLKVWGGLWLKLYLQYRLELTCNQDLRVICTCLSGKLKNSYVYMKIAEIKITV